MRTERRTGSFITGGQHYLLAIADASMMRMSAAPGATAIDLGPSDVRWTVLADPEGNEFCLLAPA